MPTPFRPDSLDLATLRRLAKNLKKGYPEVFPGTEIPLHQAQELLARALRYPDWHHAVHARPPVPATPPSNPLLVPDPPAPSPLTGLWSNAALRSLLFTLMQQGLDAHVPLMDQLQTFVRIFRRMGEPQLAQWLTDELGRLDQRADSIAWWRHVAEGIAPHSAKVAMLVRLMARGHDWPRGLRAIVQQCALEQGHAFYRDAQPRPPESSAPLPIPLLDANPWRLTANRHMVFYALSACLDQGMPLREAFQFLRDDFRENGHEALAVTMDPWVDRLGDREALSDLAVQVAPYSLESAALLLVNEVWDSAHRAMRHAEAQSARELRHERNEPLDPDTAEDVPLTVRNWPNHRTGR